MTTDGTHDTAATVSSGRTIAYQPALDGVRAVAVAVVLLFHLDLSWMSGGYLGVSVFFTLSGFLITSLLVAELGRSGTIRLGRFYGRRARRLLPASLVCLAGAIVLIAADVVPDRSGLRWYIFGALFQFANWVPLGLRNTYAELFNALSPTDHFWSLAIEEQFYWLWPLTMLGLFKLVGARGRAVAEWLPRMLKALVLLFVVFAISAPITAQVWNEDAAYFATWARIPEILAGAVLALIVTRTALPRWTAWLAPAALAAILLLSVITPAGRGFAYEGGLPLFALVSAALIAGLQHASPTRSLLSLPPFVFLGRISYGVYLYHWPVFVVLTPARVGWSTLPLSLLRLAVTFAIAIVSYFLIEQPIRERRVLRRPRFALTGAALAIPVVAILGVSQVSNSSSYEASTATLPPVDSAAVPLVPANTTTTIDTVPTGSGVEVAGERSDTTDGTTADDDADTGATDGTDPAASSGGSAGTSGTDGSDGDSTDGTVTSDGPDSGQAGAGAGPAPTTTTTPGPTTTQQLMPSRPVRMLVIGDSTALATATGLIAWSKDHPELAQVEQQGYGGCGIVTGSAHLFRGEFLPDSSGCATLFDETIPQRIRDGKPDIVVIVSSFWDVTDHLVDGDPEPHSVLEPAWRDLTRQRFLDYTQLLFDSGAPRVALVLYPTTDFGWTQADEPADDPLRYSIFHDVERDTAAAFPGRASVIDLAGWSDEQGLTNNTDARPDGVHWSEAQSKRIAEDWLGDQIVQSALH